jgi:acyl carrier protein
MADTSHIREIRDQVDRVMASRYDDIYERTRSCVASALAIDTAKIAPTSSLIGDLGAESLDLLDLVFRLETEFKIKIPQGGIMMVAREGLEDHFEDRGLLSDAALERLRLLMPEAPADRLVTGLRGNDVPGLFTTETFARIVAWRLSATTPSSAH